MSRPDCLLAIGLLAVAFAPRPARCQSRARSDSPAVIPLHAGRTPVDLLGTGTSGTIDVADRENYNAHGHHLALFQVHAPRYADDPTSAKEWQVVPFFGSGADSRASEEIFRTVEGADCNLRDLRVLRTAPGRPVTVVIGERTLGRSYADSAAVQFQYYELRRNAAGDVGYPSYYFQQTRVVDSTRPYCDVDDAFDRELHLGRTGLLKWGGPR
jgi:hypothetical protein